GHGRSAHAVETVAPGNEVALDLALCSIPHEGKPSPGAVDVAYLHVARLEHDLSAGGEARGDQVLQDFVLRVEHDRLAGGQVGEVDAVAATGEAELAPFVAGPPALHALAPARALQEPHGAVLEHAGAKRPLDARPAAFLQHDGVDAFGGQQMREHQPRRTRAD